MVIVLADHSMDWSIPTNVITLQGAMDGLGCDSAMLWWGSCLPTSVKDESADEDSSEFSYSAESKRSARSPARSEPAARGTARSSARAPV